jgi:hypothetical protein
MTSLTPVMAGNTEPVSSGNGQTIWWTQYYPAPVPTGEEWIAGSVKAARLGNSQSEWLVTSNSALQLKNSYDASSYREWRRLIYSTSHGQYNLNQPIHVEWSPGQRDTGSGTITFGVSKQGPEASFALHWDHQWRGSYYFHDTDQGGYTADGWSFRYHHERFKSSIWERSKNWDVQSHGNVWEANPSKHKALYVAAKVEYRLCAHDTHMCGAWIWEDTGWKYKNYYGLNQDENGCEIGMEGNPESDNCQALGSLPPAVPPPLPLPELIPPSD